MDTTAPRSKDAPHSTSFAEVLAAHSVDRLRRAETTTLQVNVGKVCNQACHHCHVEAGPKRTESMRADVVDRVLAVLDGSPTVSTVDITGGAPELNPEFRRLVIESRRRGRHDVPVAYQRRLGRSALRLRFNQMLEVPMPGMRSVWAIESVSGLSGRGIATGAHRFGCTAGAGSSCGGSLS